MADSNVLRLGGDPLPGLGYPPLAAFNIPVTAGLVGAHFFSSGKDIAKINYGGSVDGGWVGTGMVEHDGYMTLNGNGYLETGIVESEAMTLLALVRRTENVSIGVAGTYVSNTDAGFALFAQTPYDYWQSVVGKTGSTSGNAILALSTTPWRILEMSVPAVGPHILYDHTAGTLGVSAVSTAREPSNRQIRFGRLRSGGFSGNFDIACGVLHNGTYNGAQRTEMINWARQFGADNGITA